MRPLHGAVWVRGSEVRLCVAADGMLPPRFDGDRREHPRARLKSCAPTETAPLLLISGNRRYSRSSAMKLEREGWTYIGFPLSWDLGTSATPIPVGYRPKVGDILLEQTSKPPARSVLLLTDSIAENTSVNTEWVRYAGNILQDWQDLTPFERLPRYISGSPRTTIEGVAALLGEITATRRRSEAGAAERARITEERRAAFEKQQAEYEARLRQSAQERAANFAAVTEKLDQIIAQTVQPVVSPLAVRILQMLREHKIDTLIQVAEPRDHDGAAAVRLLIDDYENLVQERVRHNAAEVDWKQQQAVLEQEIAELRDQRDTLIARDLVRDSEQAHLHRRIDDMTGHRDRWQATHRDLVSAVGSALGIEPTAIDYSGSTIADEIPKVIFRRQTEAVGGCAALVALVLGLGTAAIYRP